MESYLLYTTGTPKEKRSIFIKLECQSKIHNHDLIYQV